MYKTKGILKKTLFSWSCKDVGDPYEIILFMRCFSQSTKTKRGILTQKNNGSLGIPVMI